MCHFIFVLRERWTRRAATENSMCSEFTTTMRVTSNFSQQNNNELPHNLVAHKQPDPRPQTRQGPARVQVRPTVCQQPPLRWLTLSHRSGFVALFVSVPSPVCNIKLKSTSHPVQLCHKKTFSVTGTAHVCVRASTFKVWYVITVHSCCND